MVDAIRVFTRVLVFDKLAWNEKKEIECRDFTGCLNFTMYILFLIIIM